MSKSKEFWSLMTTVLAMLKDGKTDEAIELLQSKIPETSKKRIRQAKTRICFIPSLTAKRM